MSKKLVEALRNIDEENELELDSYILDPISNEMRAALCESQTLLGQDKF